VVLDFFLPILMRTTSGSFITSLRTVSRPMAHWFFKSVMLKCFSKVVSVNVLLPALLLREQAGIVYQLPT
jgi:nitrogen fixation protein FixH